MYVCMCVYTLYVCMHAYMHVCMNVFMCVSVCVCMYVCMYARKRYVIKHNLITEVYLMTVRWKQLHVSAFIGHHHVV